MSDPIGEKPRLDRTNVSAVKAFSDVMITKLRENAHKRHWHGFSAYYFLQRVEQELEEVQEALEAFENDASEQNANNLVRECADVANFMMMIADNAWRDRLEPKR